jgi:IclR family transcriptional regulator, pca regulon regulatory protein
MPSGENDPQPADRGRAAGYRVEALAKGLRILALFSERETALRLTTIVERTGIPMPTAYRLLSTLDEEGFVERVAEGRYRPGANVLRLGFAALAALDVVEVARDRLRALADETGETVNLGVLSGDKVLYLIRLRNSDLVTANIQVGSSLPAVYTSMGKVLLAHLDGPAFDGVVRPESFQARGGPNAVRSLTDLRRQLAQVRAQGYAVQDQEVASGLRSIAGPVRDATGRVTAAVNIAVQTAEYDVRRLLVDLKAPLLAACDEVSRRLGHRPAAHARSGDS